MRLRTVSYLIGLLGFLLALVAGLALEIIPTQMQQILLQRGYAETVELGIERLILDLRDSARFNTFWTSSRNHVFLQERNQARQRMLKELRRMKTVEHSPQDSALISDAEHRAYQLFAAQDRTPFLKGKALPFSVLESRVRLLDQAIVPLKQLSQSKETEFVTIAEKISRLERLSNWIARTAMVISALLFAAIVWFLHFYINVPIGTLIDVVSRYKDGDHSARAPAKQLKVHEVIQAGDAFNNLADRMNDLERRRLEYVAGTIHDIRNPLTALKTAASILRSSEHEITPRSRKLLKIIEEEIDRMRHLVDDTIDAQQISSGRLVLSCQDVDLANLTDEVVRLWQVASKEHPVTLHGSEEHVRTLCDPRRIQQALNNLVNNAIKYSPEGGPVDVEVAATEKLVTISVSDRGMGIAPEERKRIFEPFRRSAAARALIPGTGLGLSSAKKIVEAHGGSIEVDSQLGHGSTFRIHLPRVA